MADEKPPDDGNSNGTPPADDDAQKERLHKWLDEWADKREAALEAERQKNPRTERKPTALERILGF